MRGIGDSGAKSRICHTVAVHQFAARALQPQPEDVRAQLDTERVSKDVQEARRRQPGDAGQVPERELVRRRELLTQFLQRSTYLGVNPWRLPAGEEVRANPGLHSFGCQRGYVAQIIPPRANGGFADEIDGGRDFFEQRGAQIAFGVDEREQNLRTARVDLVRSVGLHQSGGAASPSLIRSASNPNGSSQRHHQLYGVVPMRGARQAGSPDDHRGGPEQRPRRGGDQHGAIMTSTLIAYGRRPLAQPCVASDRTAAVTTWSHHDPRNWSS